MKLDLPPPDILRKTLATKSILVVDSSSAVAKLVSQICLKIGFREADTLPSGAVMPALLARRYDVVMAEIYMTPMSGLELLLRMRQTEQLKATPFLLMTDPLGMDAILAAHRAGVDRCILKPFSTDTLREKLAYLLR